MERGAVAGAPAPNVGRGRTLVITAVTAVAAVAVWGVAASFADTSEGAGGRFVSSDGLISFPMPDGWYDATDDYRAYVLDAKGEESFLRGYFLLDVPVFEYSSNFCSLSIVEVDSTTADLNVLGPAFADSWLPFFDEVDVVDEQTRTTDAGDGLWYRELEGTGDGEEFSLLIVVVRGNHHMARFGLEVRPEHYGGREVLLDALQRATFAS